MLSYGVGAKHLPQIDFKCIHTHRLANVSPLLFQKTKVLQ